MDSTNAEIYWYVLLSDVSSSSLIVFRPFVGVYCVLFVDIHGTSVCSSIHLWLRLSTSLYCATILVVVIGGALSYISKYQHYQDILNPVSIHHTHIHTQPSSSFLAAYKCICIHNIMTIQLPLRTGCICTTKTNSAKRLLNGSSMITDTVVRNNLRCLSLLFLIQPMILYTIIHHSITY